MAINLRSQKRKRRKASSSLEIGSVQHIGDRENQQDTLSVSDVSDLRLTEKHGLLAVIADGMGGMADGKAYSWLVSESFQESFKEDFAESDAEVPSARFLLELLASANRAINRKIGRRALNRGGSTLVAAVIRDNLLDFISVGDSRIYLSRGGSLIQLNREHSYGAELDEQAARDEISFKEAEADAQRNALTSYIGMGKLAHIDRSIRPIRLIPNDRVLLMSDGVFSTLTDEEIQETLYDDPRKTAARLENAVLDKRKPNQDNFSAIIICFL